MDAAVVSQKVVVAVKEWRLVAASGPVLPSPSPSLAGLIVLPLLPWRPAAAAMRPPALVVRPVLELADSQARVPFDR